MAEFVSNCTPRFVNVSKSTGCTLTRANILGITPQMFADTDSQEVGMYRLIETAQEARVAGYIESTLEMLLYSRLTPLKGAVTEQKIPGSPSVILPYIYRGQKRNINNNYFRIQTGAATPGAGSGGIHPGSWDLTIRNTVSTFASALTALEGYFQPGQHLGVECLDSSDNALTIDYLITASENADSGSTIQAKVTVVPNYSVAGYNALSAGDKTDLQPTAGLAFAMGNSISDFESFCQQGPAVNPNSLLTYWLQNTRETHEYSDEYLAALSDALLSGFFHSFQQLPLAEQKRQQHALAMKAWVNSVWFGQRINELQTVEGYRSLPTVVDPANPTCVLEYKANALGFKQQLIDCSRYHDHVGGVLNLDTKFSDDYAIMRAREADGGTIETIDNLTDRTTAGKVLQLFTSFYRAKYGVNTIRNYAEQGGLKFENQVMMPYISYQLPPDVGGFNSAWFHHRFFDDRLSAYDSAISNRGRAVWTIDWTDIQIGIAATASVTRQTNIADNLYNCVIKPNIRHYELMSRLWTSIIEDPSRHYLRENFSTGCPTLTVAGCSV